MSKFREWVQTLVLVVAVGALVYDRVAPRPNPYDRTVNGVNLGRSYAPALLEAYAKACDQTSEMVRKGDPMAKVMVAHQEAFQKARQAAFTQSIAPQLATIVKEGTEPDELHRAEFAQAWSDIAKGIRGK